MRPKAAPLFRPDVLHSVRRYKRFLEVTLCILQLQAHHAVTLGTRQASIDVTETFFIGAKRLPPLPRRARRHRSYMQTLAVHESVLAAA
jgi:hypothetical protein